MASTLSIFIVVVITSGFTTKSLSGSGQAEGCGGMIEADNGTLQLEPSHRPCLWLITLTKTTGIRLELSPLMLAPILVIPHQNVDQNLTSIWISGSKGVFYNFQAKSLTIMTPHSRTEKSNLSWTGLAADISGVSFSTKFVNASEGTMAWKHELAERNEIFWVFHQRTRALISWNLDTQLPACYTMDPCQSLYFVVVEIVRSGTISEIQKTCEGSSKLSMMVAKGSQVLIVLHINAPIQAKTSFQLTWKYDQQFTRSIGLIASTFRGVFVVPFNSTQAHIAKSKDVGDIWAVVFDWNSSQIYWLQDETGIMRANLNGSERETLLLDKTSKLRGLAIDPVSENLYFGNWSSKAIIVCNKNASKCSTINANAIGKVIGSFSSYVRDLAIHWSKGFLFCSISDTGIVRFNLDGSDPKFLMGTTRVGGIAVDEEEDRLYWGHKSGIQRSELDGGEIWNLPNLYSDISDLAIHGENIYYASDLHSVPSIGVISKVGIKLYILAELKSSARFLSLYGKKISSLPPNPCDKSKCAHLCVRISLSSSRCLCPDGEKLASDGTTCTA